MTFSVGQKVVCVNDGNAYGAAYAHGLRRGSIYTIEAIGPAHGFEPNNLAIVGIISAWRPERFRPIVEHKTDISVFTQMLTPQGVEA